MYEKLKRVFKILEKTLPTSVLFVDLMHKFTTFVRKKVTRCDKCDKILWHGEMPETWLSIVREHLKECA